MCEIVYCKDCAYAEPNNLDAYHAAKIGVFCTRYKQNTAGIHGCDNGKPKAKTNADRIRAMTDEELAEWINRLEPFKCHKGYKFANGCWEDETDCIACILEWLKQEAT